MNEDRALAAMLSDDRWFPATAHIVLLAIVVLLTGAVLPRPFLISWIAPVVVIILSRAAVAGRARHPETDPRSVVRVTRLIVIALGLAWGVGAALAAPHLPAATFAMLLMALAGLLAGGINTFVALPLLKPEPATSLQMLLIALFLFFMINQHRRAHALLVDRQQADQNQRALVQELQTAIADVRTLEGILPICASCKRIKNEAGGWEAVEVFVRERTDAEFSHGLCPDCAVRDWGTVAS